MSQKVFRVVVGVLAFGMLVELLFVAVSMAPPAATAKAPAPMTSTLSAEELRAHHDRMRSAEQMVKRLRDKFARMRKICNAVTEYSPRVSEECKKGVSSDHPIFAAIPEAASIGDPVRWAAVIDIVDKLERELDRSLSKAETYVKWK